MTVDRFIAVRFPLKAKTLCTSTKANITVLAIFLAMITYNIPHSFYARVIQRLCVGLAVKDSFSVVLGWMTMLVQSLFPFSIILVLNFFIIVTISRRGQYFKDDTPTVGGEHAEKEVYHLVNYGDKEVHLYNGHTNIYFVYFLNF